MKKNVSILLAIALLLALAGCGQPAAQTPAPAPQSAAPAEPTPAPLSPLDAAVVKVLDEKVPVEISFWTGTGAANFPFLEAMVAAFQVEYPNITVDFSNQGPLGELTDKLTQNIVSRSTPTISNIAPTTFSEYVNSGALVDLAPYYNNERIGYSDAEKAAFYPHYIAQVESYGPAGTMYGFPTNKKTADILMYNKTIFDEHGWSAPATWDDVVTYSKAIFEETGAAGMSFDSGAYPDGVYKTLSQQWGSPYIKADGSAEINNAASKAALEFYKSNMDAGYFTQAALMPSASGNYAGNGFLMGECNLMVGPAAGAFYSIPKEESGHKIFELGVAPMPQYDTSKPIAFFKGEDYCMFANATEEQKVAAWLLIQFMSADENNVEWLVNTANLPITSTMLALPEYKAFLNTAADGSVPYYKAAAVNAVLAMESYLKADVIVPNAGAIARECGILWESVMIGGANIDTALAETDAKVNK